MDFSILMNNATKTLRVTNRINLRQHENLVDKIVFIVPFQYNDDVDLRQFNVTAEWLDPTRVAHVDLLVPEEDVYKETFQRYFFPVTSPINRYAGEIELKLVFTMTDFETGNRYKLETDSVNFEIMSIKDYYAVLPNESFDAINDFIDKLKAQSEEVVAAAEIYNERKADNIMVNEENSTLQLVSNGKPIGNEVDVMLPSTKDDFDGENDGIINVDGVNSSESVDADDLVFIEL